MLFGKTIRSRLTLWYMSVLVVSFFILGFLVERLVRSGIYSQVDEELVDARTMVVAALDRACAEESNPDAKRLADEINELGLPPHLALQLTVGAKKIRQNSKSVPEGIFEIAGGEGPLAKPVTAQAADGARAWRVCLARSRNPANRYEVILARDLTPIDNQLGAFHRIILIAIPLILLVAAGGGWFLAGRALDPVSRIAAQARQIEAQALDRRLETGNPNDELGQLVQVLNDMFERLERTFQQQRQFIDDAAHELRTPAAILRSQADVALERPRSAAEYASTLETMRSETEHLSTIVDDLLLSARADAAQLQVSLTPVDLMEIVDESCRAMKPLILRKRLTLNWKVGEEVPVSADAKLVRRAVTNLLANAIHFTPSAGTILVAVHLRDRFGSVEIADTGKGITEEDLPHIFERFYRGRRDSPESDGAGLGLSIVNMIAQMHGGRVSVSNNSGGGSVFELRIPGVGV